ncbi:MAG: hypothetical protein O9266_06025 [Porphyrobacter sp.]|jgi:hypothetical protein|nr:hypothetical protein [Porphyrobacter sp.]
MITRYALAAPVAALLMLGACAKPAAEDAAGEETAAAMETPAEAPKLAPDDPLTKVTCADFLATAEVATAQPADDAALAAQDELANGLTWLHGYLYAKQDGGIEPLSQTWMQTTAKRVYEACSAAEKPAETSLFEVATS